MNIKNLSKKQIAIILGILLIVIAAIIIVVAYHHNNKKIETSSKDIFSNQINNIPLVTDENTKFSISSLEEAESIEITVEEKLEDFELYFLIESFADIPEDEAEFEKDKASYSLYENPILLTENANLYFVYEKNNEFSTEPYLLEIHNIVPKLQDSEEVTEEQLQAAKVDKNNKANNKATYYIKVNYGANTVTIYGKDENGDYTVPVKAMVCSCGRATPKGGVYKTSKGYTWGTLVGGVYGQYSTRIVGSILFHSVPYTAMSKDTLEYWEFDKLGTTASAGCVRLMVSDSKWIFYNCEAGTMVEFYSDSNPGPLGKPSAPKISDNEMCRNWDPTDYVDGNPWLEISTPDEPSENDNAPTDDNAENNQNDDDVGNDNGKEYED